MVKVFSPRHRPPGLPKMSASGSERVTIRETPTVDLHLAVRNDRLDLALLLEILQAPSRKGAVDLQSVDEGGDCDEAIGLNIFVELLGGGLVKQDGVLGLVLYCKGGCNVSQGSYEELQYPRTSACSQACHQACHRACHQAYKTVLGENPIVDLPFPLDHFFFCFFAPVLAAGAIVADQKTLSFLGCVGVFEALRLAAWISAGPKCRKAEIYF